LPPVRAVRSFRGAELRPPGGKKKVMAKRSFKKRSFKKRSAVKRRSIRKRRAPVRSRFRGKRNLRAPVGKKFEAHITESIQISTQGLNSGAPYDHFFTISDFLRADTLAASFRYYRATKVVWTYVTDYDTYNASAGAGGLVAGYARPNMYVAMDRTGQAPYQSVDDFLDAGVRPQPVSRNKKIAYVPNVREEQFFPLNAAMDGGALLPGTPQTALAPKKAKWIASYASGGHKPSVDSEPLWYGHQVVYDQASPAFSEDFVRVQCQVTWQFKDPMQPTVGPDPILPLAKRSTKVTPKVATLASGGAEGAPAS